MNEAARVEHCFVVPALDGPVTGGTLYNAELCRALAERSSCVSVSALGEPRLFAKLHHARYVWVDSLYLSALPELAREAPGSVGLLTHYLPSFVALGRAALPAELREEERLALQAADALLVTSPFMRTALVPLVAPEKPFLVVPPGTRARLAPRAPNPLHGVSALLIGNVVPGKGIEPLLQALSETLRPGDRFQLSIIGSLETDPAYAARCRRLVVDSPALAGSVTLHGACTPEQTLALLGESGLLLSASVMESYGMALAEARVVGVPILAIAGGNTGAHVLREAGGQLVLSVTELGQACLELARDPARHGERIERARRHAPVARSWECAAREFTAQLASLEK